MAALVSAPHVPAVVTADTPVRPDMKPSGGRPDEPFKGVDPDSFPKSVNDVIESEIGVPTLLNRLKQSIVSANDFALFLKKRAYTEETHAKELQKLAKVTRDGPNHRDGRQGSHLSSFNRTLAMSDSMAENGLQFAYSLHTMYESLMELSSKLDRQRKHWKHQSSQAEKKAKDAETHMAKAKAKYFTLADEYEMVKTGDRTAGRHFKFRQHSEDELRQKAEAAEGEYAAKVQLARAERRELVEMHRPSAVIALKELIVECDAGLDLQMQKFATFNEKLALSNGIVLCPADDTDAQGISTVMSQINSHDDVCASILDARDKVPPPPAEIKYDQHRAVAPSSGMASMADPSPPAPYLPAGPLPSDPLAGSMSSLSFMSSNPAPTAPDNSSYPYSQAPSELPESRTAREPTYSPVAYPPSLAVANPQPQPGPEPSAASTAIQPFQSLQPPQAQAAPTDAPTLNPNWVFNISLWDYCERAREYVPALVTQCIEVLKQGGLDTPGLYVTPASPSQMQMVQRIADTYMSVTDNRPVVTWQNASMFNHDPAVVAELLCYWLTRLPEPLIDYRYHPDCFNSIRTQQSVLLHRTINELPNPHYATLHRITFHLRSVLGRSQANGVTIEALAARFGHLFMRPTLNTEQDLAVQVIETVITRWDDFFEVDEE